MADCLRETRKERKIRMINNDRCLPGNDNMRKLTRSGTNNS